MRLSNSIPLSLPAFTVPLAFALFPTRLVFRLTCTAPATPHKWLHTSAASSTAPTALFFIRDALEAVPLLLHPPNAEPLRDAYEQLPPHLQPLFVALVEEQPSWGALTLAAVPLLARKQWDNSPPSCARCTAACIR